jgi:Mlc titration factor MtfA (ptsG expression regulator)
MFLFKKRRRARLRNAPFPSEWIAILRRNVPYYRRLTPAEQAELCGHIQVFLHEKRFEGCGGLEVTEEMRLTIAGQACTLLLNRESDYFPGMQTIFLYPRYFQVREKRSMPDGTVLEEDEEFEGESWERGPVVLAWDEVKRDAADPDDGYNVVLHEFAHQLDGESGAEDGVPPLKNHSMYESWARIMRREYERLRDEVDHDRPHLIDSYGASSPEEFFAVVTEAFFEVPRALQRRHGELYELLKRYYKQDPAGRIEPRRTKK